MAVVVCLPSSDPGQILHMDEYEGQFQHGSKWLGTLTSPILLILGPDVPPRELFKTTKNFRPRTPRGGAMPFSKFGDMAKPCTFFFKYLSIYLAGNDKLGING